MSRGWWLVAATLAGVWMAENATAEQAFVSDELTIGLHTRRSFSSAIVRMLPSGTELEILRREGDLVEVRISDGTTGWVDSSYTVTEPPARLRALELENRLLASEQDLEVARETLEALQAEIRKLTRINAEAAEPNTVLNANRRGTLTDALRDLQTLTTENQDLKRRLAEFTARTVASALASGDEDTATGSPPSSSALTSKNGSLSTLVRAPATTGRPSVVGFENIGGFTIWNWIAVGSMLLLVFSLGGYWVDWGIRRRHGGFRL